MLDLAEGHATYDAGSYLITYNADLATLEGSKAKAGVVGTAPSVSAAATLVLSEDRPIPPSPIAKEATFTGCTEDQQGTLNDTFASAQQIERMEKLATSLPKPVGKRFAKCRHVLMSLTFLHTADWQLGKQFAQVPGDPGAALRRRRMDTVKVIAELARERRVDAVLVAGDVFEDNAVSNETLRRTMHALASFEGPWVLLPGNHDAGLTQSAWNRLRRLDVVPANVMLADRPEPIALCGGRLMVLPAPLQRRHEVGDLTNWFDTLRSDAGVLRVGLAHGTVMNRLPAAAKAHNPIADTRAETAHLDYLALGDWHGTLEVANRTWYAGTPEPDRFRTNEPSNVLLVTLRERGAPPQVEKIPVGYYRWTRLTFDVMDDRALAVLDGRLAALGESERTLVRLKLTGTLDLATRQQLDELLDGWRARLHFLDIDDTALLARTGLDDIATLIAELGVTGFVRDALETLVGIKGDAGHPNRAADAGRALQILYHEHKRLSENGP